MIELKPCPFCNGQASYHEEKTVGYVYCTNCGCRTEGSYVFRSNWRGYESNVWNTRALTNSTPE